MLATGNGFFELILEIQDYLEYIDNIVLDYINHSIVLTVLVLILYAYFKWQFVKAEKGLDKYKSVEWPVEIILAFILFSIYIFALNYLSIARPDLFSRIIQSIYTPIIIIIAEFLLYICALLRFSKEKMPIRDKSINGKLKEDLHLPILIFLYSSVIIIIAFLLGKILSTRYLGIEEFGLIFGRSEFIHIELWITAIAMYCLKFFDT